MSFFMSSPPARKALSCTRFQKKALSTPFQPIPIAVPLLGSPRWRGSLFALFSTPRISIPPNHFSFHFNVSFPFNQRTRILNLAYRRVGPFSHDPHTIAPNIRSIGLVFLLLFVISYPFRFLPTIHGLRIFSIP